MVAQGTQDALATRMLMYKMMGCGALLPPVQQGRDSHPLVVGHGPTTFPQHCLLGDLLSLASFRNITAWPCLTRLAHH